MNHFDLKDGELHCEEVPLRTIANECGTPTYVYSHATLSRHVQVFDQGLAGMKHTICFSVKANSNIAILHLLASLGVGADIVSGGELQRALKAGIDADKIVFSGVGKRADEMAAALDAGIHAFNVESRAELELLNQVAGDKGTRAPVSLRINPDVDAKTHPYISTGLQENKFGIAWDKAVETYRRAQELPHIDIVGVDCHIGSQLTDTAPFVDAATKLVGLVEELISMGIDIRNIDVGGGLGIPYSEPGESAPPSPAIYGEDLVRALSPLASRDINLICEPGRVIAGNAGVLLTEVLYCKNSSAKNFVIVDAAFNDLMRPALYSAYHPIWPVVPDEGRELLDVDVVGPICESSDFLAKDRQLQKVETGELLAVGSAGAYGFVMSSNYNSRTRPCEVLVKGDEYAVIREREELDSLYALERIPDFLS